MQLPLLHKRPWLQSQSTLHLPTLGVQTPVAGLQVPLMICATVTPDMQFPDTANLIADALDIRNGFCFDLHAACSGFLYALATASRFIESGGHRKVIVVGADKMSSIVDYTDRSTCILFGDGAAAVMLEPDTQGFGLQDALLRSDGAGHVFLFQKAGGSRYPASRETVEQREHFVYQNGAPVFKAAVSGMAEVIGEVMQRNSLSVEDVSWVAPHQANRRIIEQVARMADFPLEKMMINIHKYGNTTAATIPLCLWEWESQLKPGDNIILTAFGGGFTWGAIYVKWAY